MTYNADHDPKPDTKMQVGDVVLYVDEHRHIHTALVIVVWNDKMLNLLHLSDDPRKTDQYGRQIERNATSVAAREEWNYNAGRFFIPLHLNDDIARMKEDLRRELLPVSA